MEVQSISREEHKFKEAKDLSEELKKLEQQLIEKTTERYKKTIELENLKLELEYEKSRVKWFPENIERLKKEQKDIQMVIDELAKEPVEVREKFKKDLNNSQSAKLIRESAADGTPVKTATKKDLKPVEKIFIDDKKEMQKEIKEEIKAEKKEEVKAQKEIKEEIKAEKKEEGKVQKEIKEEIIAEKKEEKLEDRKSKDLGELKNLFPKERSKLLLLPVGSENPDEKQRNQVINEIINTEVDYVNDLDYLNESYIKPIQTQKILDESTHARLFTHLNFIITVNKELLEDLMKKVQQPHAPVGSSFLQISAFMKGYSNYCADQDDIQQLIEELNKKNNAFKKLLNEKKQEAKGFDLFSYVIKPVQRLCKYPLLLRELLKFTPNTHPDYKDLQEAYTKIEAAVLHVNEAKRKKENGSKMIAINQLFGDESLNLLQPSRYFIKEGEVEKYKEKKR